MQKFIVQRTQLQHWVAFSVVSFCHAPPFLWSQLAVTYGAGGTVFHIKDLILLEKELRQVYDSRAWRRKRLDILQRDFYECQDCRARIERANKEGIVLSGDDRKIRKAVEVHHVKELREFPELALEDSNLISLCTQCHNLRHGRHKYKYCKKQKAVTDEKW